MESFYLEFEKRTGFPRTVALQAIPLISGYLSRNYPNEFLHFLQYFLAYTMEKRNEGTAGKETATQNQTA